jgi:hypothetical protein
MTSAHDETIWRALLDFGLPGFERAAMKWWSGECGPDEATNQAGYRRWKEFGERARVLVNEAIKEAIKEARSSSMEDDSLF